jgi:hypothetical protein
MRMHGSACRPGERNAVMVGGDVSRETLGLRCFRRQKDSVLEPDSQRALKNAPFCPIWRYASLRVGVRGKFLILKILGVLKIPFKNRGSSW